MKIDGGATDIAKKNSPVQPICMRNGLWFRELLLRRCAVVRFPGCFPGGVKDICESRCSSNSGSSAWGFASTATKTKVHINTRQGYRGPHYTLLPRTHTSTPGRSNWLHLFGLGDGVRPAGCRTIWACNLHLHDFGRWSGTSPPCFSSSFPPHTIIKHDSGDMLLRSRSHPIAEDGEVVVQYGICGPAPRHPSTTTKKGGSGGVVGRAAADDDDVATELTALLDEAERGGHDPEDGEQPMASSSSSSPSCTWLHTSYHNITGKDRACRWMGGGYGS